MREIAIFTTIAVTMIGTIITTSHLNDRIKALEDLSEILIHYDYSQANHYNRLWVQQSRFNMGVTKVLDQVFLGDQDEQDRKESIGPSIETGL